MVRLGKLIPQTDTLLPTVREDSVVAELMSKQVGKPVEVVVVAVVVAVATVELAVVVVG